MMPQSRWRAPQASSWRNAEQNDPAQSKLDRWLLHRPHVGHNWLLARMAPIGSRTLWRRFARTGAKSDWPARAHVATNSRTAGWMRIGAIVVGNVMRLSSFSVNVGTNNALLYHPLGHWGQDAARQTKCLPTGYRGMLSSAWRPGPRFRPQAVAVKLDHGCTSAGRPGSLCASHRPGQVLPSTATVGPRVSHFLPEWAKPPRPGEALSGPRSSPRWCRDHQRLQLVRARLD